MRAASAGRCNTTFHQRRHGIVHSFSFQEVHLKSITLASLVFSAAVIAGCGGGSGTTPAAATAATGTGTAATSTAGATTPATPTTPTTPTAPTTPTTATTPTTPTLASTGYIVDYYGDSTIWGVDGQTGGGRVATPAPLVFDQSLQTAVKHVVNNEGVSSTTCIQLLNGTDGVHPDWTTQMANTKANVVIVNHGINDSFDPNESVDQYKACLTSLVTIATQKGKKIVLETPNPAKNSGGGTSGLDAYVTGMRQVAAAASVPLIDEYQMLTDFLNGRAVTTICPDGLHPTQDVYTMKGQFAAKTFAAFGL
jgi:lysophospholipase L1-like esterase